MDVNDVIPVIDLLTSKINAFDANAVPLVTPCNASGVFVEITEFIFFISSNHSVNCHENNLYVE